MKKLLALLVALSMVLSLCPALADETPELKDARSYINLMYKNKPASTPKDYELVGTVPGDAENYTVEWTTDSDTIAVTVEENGMVKIDVDENNPKEVAYKLTATIKDAAGNSIQISFDRVVPAAINLDVMTEEEIVAVAYTLDGGAALPAMTALTGKIVAIPTPYSEEYKNITVNIQVGDLADQPIQCYRLTGDFISLLKEGDEITVAGTIKNYKGTIEFDKGCVLIPDQYCQSARVALFAHGTLEDGAAMSRSSTMTGGIIAIPSAYSEEYKNITVNIAVPGLEDCFVQCYRLTGEGVETLKEGDVITVSGTIKNYKGTIEFDKGCTLDHIQTEEDLMNELISALSGIEGLEESDAKGLEGLLDSLGGLLGSLEAEGAEDSAGLDGLLGSLGGLLGGLESSEDAAGLDGLLGGLLGGLESSEDTAGLDLENLTKLLEDENQTPESLVLGFLNELGVDTKGKEEEISSAVTEVKNAASGLFSSLSDKLDSALNKASEKLEGVFSTLGNELEGLLNTAVEKLGLPTEITQKDLDQLIGSLENILKEMQEQEPDGKLTKVLADLLESAKTVSVDNQESIQAFVAKLPELLKAFEGEDGKALLLQLLNKLAPENQ